MARLTTTAFLILGLLDDRDWSAYTLAEQIGKGITELWPRAGRQLYNVPKRLVAEGLAVATTESTGQRNRTIYSITPAGRDALRSWLASPTAPPALEFEAMVRVLLAPSGTLEDLRSTLETMGAQARESRDLFVSHARYLLDNEGGTYPERLHVLSLANLFMVEHFSNIVEWSKWALEQTQGWDETVAPARTEPDQSIAILERSIRIGTDRGADPDTRDR
jgi:DNA-binding PadR family transcriptional regulator